MLRLINNMKCCVFTRFFNEIIYMDAFIEHYINLGFDKIIILYTDVVECEIPNKYSEKVLLYTVENNGNKTPELNKNLIPKYIDWVLHVDSDEFLLLHKKYKTIHDYINEKLKYHPDINLFFFVWSWVHKFDEYDLKLNDIFRNYKKMVGDKYHDRKINNEVWIKSMFKRSEFDILHIHCPSMKNRYNIYSNEYISVNSDEKIKTLLYKKKTDQVNFYEEAVLIHIATRSMNNAIFKSNNIHKTQVKKKKMANEIALKKYIKNNNMKNENEYNIISNIKENIGYKIEWPIKCLKMNEIVININDFLREEQEHNFMADCKDDYYKLFEDNIINDENMRIAIDKVINTFNVIFIE